MTTRHQPSTARTFTSDFAASPYRVAYVLAERAYVIIEVATGRELDWRDRYAEAYERAAELNTRAAEEAALAALEARAVLADEQAEKDAEAEALAAMNTFAVDPDAARPTVIVTTAGSVERLVFRSKRQADKKILALIAAGYRFDNQALARREVAA